MTSVPKRVPVGMGLGASTDLHWQYEDPGPAEVYLDHADVGPAEVRVVDS